MIIDRIIETYDTYRTEVVKQRKHPKYLKVVIAMHPRTHRKFQNECIKYMHINFEEYFVFYLGSHSQERFINLYGNDTPIVLDETLPEDIDFIMIAEEDYKRQHNEHQLHQEL